MENVLYAMIILFNPAGTNVPLTVLEFHGKTACDTAMPLVKALHPSIRAVCVPKAILTTEVKR